MTGDDPDPKTEPAKKDPERFGLAVALRTWVGGEVRADRPLEADALIAMEQPLTGLTDITDEAMP